MRPPTQEAGRMSLVFFEEDHRYEQDGVQVPSVTGILKASGLIDFSGIPATILEAAQERGRVVHKALHYFNERDLDVDGFCATYPTYAGYLQAWVTFCEQRKFEAALCERRVASRRYRVAGTLDCLGLLDGKPVLLDFATGRPEDVAKDLQTGAYFLLASEWQREDPPLAEFFAAHPGIQRYAVALRKDGTFRLEHYTTPTDFRRFVTLVEAQQIVASYKGSREVAA
jgi:hypothetical protein